MAKRQHRAAEQSVAAQSSTREDGLDDEEARGLGLASFLRARSLLAARARFVFGVCCSIPLLRFTPSLGRDRPGICSPSRRLSAFGPLEPRTRGRGNATASPEPRGRRLLLGDDAQAGPLVDAVAITTNRTYAHDYVAAYTVILLQLPVQ